MEKETSEGHNNTRNLSHAPVLGRVDCGPSSADGLDWDPNHWGPKIKTKVELS